MRIENNKLIIDQEGNIPKFVEQVDQVSFSGPKAKRQEQDVTYVTERCVIKLIDGCLTIVEIAPGVDLQKDILDQAATEIKISSELSVMEEALFGEAPFNLELKK